jgi:hypothetical protein
MREKNNIPQVIRKKIKLKMASTVRYFNVEYTGIESISNEKKTSWTIKNPLGHCSGSSMHLMLKITPQMPIHKIN